MMGFMTTRSFILVVGLALFQLLAAPGSEALKVVVRNRKPDQEKLAAAQVHAKKLWEWKAEFSNADPEVQKLILKKEINRLEQECKNKEQDLKHAQKWDKKELRKALRDCITDLHIQNGYKAFLDAEGKGLFMKSMNVLDGNASIRKAAIERTRWTIFGSWTFWGVWIVLLILCIVIQDVVYFSNQA